MTNTENPNLTEYVTPRQWAKDHDLTPARGSQLAAEGRFCDALTLPGGAVVVHRHSELTPSGTAQPAPHIPFPDGVLTFEDWAEKYGITPSRSILKRQPGLVYARFGTLMLVRDEAPKPDHLSLPRLEDLTPDQLATLPEKWQTVARMRREGATLQAIGDALNLTRQRVKQIEDKLRVRLAS